MQQPPVALSDNCRVKQDTVGRISGMFATGLVLYTIKIDAHLDHILFGNMLGVSIEDITIAIFVQLL